MLAITSQLPVVSLSAMDVLITTTANLDLIMRIFDDDVTGKAVIPPNNYLV